MGHRHLFLCVVVCYRRHSIEFSQDEGAELPRDHLLRAHGTLHTHCVQALLRQLWPLHRPLGRWRGIAYITGAVLYSFKRVPYIHSVFHVFVILGNICHMVAVWKMLQMFIA